MAVSEERIRAILADLVVAGDKGQEAIDGGEWDRPQLRDSEFDEVLQRHGVAIDGEDEDVILDAMHAEGPWTRIDGGWLK